jgi:hypothetical protein
MHRIDSATAEADTHGAGKDGFTGGTPPSIPPTDLTAKWFNAVQEEIAAVIEDSGRTLSDVNHNQLADSVVIRNSNGTATVTSTANSALIIAGNNTLAPVKFTPTTQPTGPNAVGDMYMNSSGVLKVCTVAGTPGTWVSVGAQV